ncbi:hypothetical protein DN757_01795 [Paenibacillus silvae]|uniref:Uncharacterized protein n=2 Tax=Paenibacillus silvae TaxID=1325358 RepID=A0A2W6NNK5_9BACL|nr:hypothetical protein DN757_01795 [Paenibacillus silvae]
MPITDKGYEYQMPDGIRNQLTKGFLELLHLGVSNWYKNKHDMTDEEFDYMNFYVYTEGNGIWSDSFEEVCSNMNKQWLAEYFKHLPWYESDLFCGEVGEMMIKLGVIKEGEQRDISE